ncbi:MAG: hypothetical protein AB8B56_17085 [Crocinitomicaceae bacterium]
MNPITTEAQINIKSIQDWFSNSINSLDQFGEYEQLQLIICAHELNFEHPNITQKVEEIGVRGESNSMDYVFQYLEQIVMMKYNVGAHRQKHFFDYWVQKENYVAQTEVTWAYIFGYLLMEENKLSTPELKQKAINWFKKVESLKSISTTAWMVYYLDRNNEHEIAKKHLAELKSWREANGSWSNFPSLTVRIAYPLALTRFANDESLKITNEYILSQPWDSYSGDITYETGLIKWLNVHNHLS